MLDVQASLVERMPGVHDVVRGEDRGVAGALMLVDEDAAAQLESGRRGELRPRHHADADDDDVAVDPLAAGRAHPLDGPVPLDRRQARAEAQVDAVVTVQVAVDPADLRSEDTLERHLRRLEHRHLEPPLPQRRRDLRADPAGADDDRLAAQRHPPPDLLDVAEVAQVQHPVEVRARHRQPPRLGPRGEQQPVVPQPLVTVDHDL